MVVTMAISDINKMMAMYAQPTEFDQNAWKTAFDIANAFTGAENSRTIANENARKHQENLATQDWRVNYANAQHQANTAKQQNALTEQQGIAQWYQISPQVMMDENGKVRTDEEKFNIARQNFTLNPVLYQQLLQNYQTSAQNIAQENAMINPQFSSQTRVMAGLAPNIVDNQGNVTNFQSGALLGQFTVPQDMANYASGNYWQNELAAQKARQEAQKAQAIAEARLPSTLEAIEERAKAAQQKQDNWQQYKINEAKQKQIDESIAQAVANAMGDKAKVNASLTALVNQYPEARDYIGRKAVLEMQLNQF